MAGPTRIILWDFSPDHDWAEQLQELLRGCERLRPKIRRIAGFAEAHTPGNARLDADVHVFTISPGNIVAALEPVSRLHNRRIHCPILALTDSQSEDPLMRLLDAGASDFLSLPLRRPEVLARLVRWLREPSEVKSASEALTQEFGLNDIVGQTLPIRSQIENVPRYARCDAPVLILGETGTGKEVFARAIHYAGPRSRHPFLPVNCGALPVDLVENELFGHESGAFTGAGGVHNGLIAQAEGGTLFLDEINSLPLPAQAKLLRFLQERSYRPLGGNRSRRADVRIISASNTDVLAAVREGHFRQDLYFRLNVLPLRLPPLRERREDIPLLANHLLERYAEAFGRMGTAFSGSAMSRLMEHDWPGNVREIENVIQRALVHSAGNVVEESDLGLPAARSTATWQSFKAQKAQVVRDFEARYLQEILAKSAGNISHAAKAANKERRTFFELLRKHDLLNFAHLNMASLADARPVARL
jgi:DNA-binding NtrC family response regulator